MIKGAHLHFVFNYSWAAIAHELGHLWGLSPPKLRHSLIHTHTTSTSWDVTYGVFNQTCSSPLCVCTAVRRDAGHRRFTSVLLGYVAALARVQTFWLGYGVALKLRLSPWLYDSSPWRQEESSDLITHTAAISDSRRGLGGVNKARGASEEEARCKKKRRKRKKNQVQREDANNRELDKSRYYLSSSFLLFLISPLIISSIQLLHKWALVAMDMSNGSPVLLDGAQW